MEITTLFGMLIFFALAISVMGLIENYQMKARIEGIQLATLEIMRGVRSHYELERQEVPPRIKRLVRLIESASQTASVDARAYYEYRVRIWELGRTLGEGPQQR
jgi:hypothetical protein